MTRQAIADARSLLRACSREHTDNGTPYLIEAVEKLCDAVESLDDRSCLPSEAIVVAFIRDRAAQYNDDSCCRVALEDIAALIRTDEHMVAYGHGELDDLLAARKPGGGQS